MKLFDELRGLFERETPGGSTTMREYPVRVYVAGPITGDGSGRDMKRNVDIAVRKGRDLIGQGYAPYVPHLDYYFPDRDEIDNWELWLRMDLAWVRVSDVVLRLPGVSRGADREVRAAHRWGIPVVTTDEELREVAKAVLRARREKSGT